MINELIGKPYRLGARGPHEYDCWGLVMEFYRRLGVVVPKDYDSTGRSRLDAIRLFKGEASAGAFEELPAAKTYCLVADVRRGHVGVLAAPEMVLHAKAPYSLLTRLDCFRALYSDTRFYKWPQ